MDYQEEKFQKIVSRLETAHKLYVISNEYDKSRILGSLDLVFEIMVNDYDFDPSFGVLYVLYGNWFISEEFGVESLQEYVKTL